MSIDYSGRLIKYGLALEQTRGTAVNPEIMIRWETAELVDTATKVLNASAIGVLDKYSGAEVVETVAKGQIAGKVTDRAFGLILYAAFGSYSVTLHAGESVVYDHTFTESQLNDSTTLTITRTDPNIQNQFAGAMLDSLEFEAKTGDFVRHTSEFTAQPSTPAATGTYANPAFEDEDEFVARHATVRFDSSLTGLSTAPAIPVNSLKLTISKGVDPYWILGQNNPVDIYATSTEIKGEMVLRYDSQTYYNLQFNNTVQAVQFQIQNTNVTIGSSSHPTITFTMPYVFLQDWKTDQALDGIVTQTIDFEAVYSLDYGYAIKGVLTNTVTSYSGASIS